MTSNNIFIRKHEVKYKEGDIIFKEGDITKEMYFILEGQVKIIKIVHNEIQNLGYLNKGDFFGEMSTFTDQKRTATVVAHKNCILLEINAESFQTMIEQASEFGLKVVKTLCTRLLKSNLIIERLIEQNQIDRIINILINEATDGGHKELEITHLNFGDVLKKIEMETQFPKEMIIQLINTLRDSGKVNFHKIEGLLTIEVSDTIRKKDQ